MQQSKNSELVRKRKVIKQPVQKCNDRGLHLKAGKVGIEKGQASWEGRGSMPSWRALPATGILHHWIPCGCRVQRCIHKEQQAVKPSTTQPWPHRLWESKERFLVGWRCLVVAVPVATCLSWTWQSPHIEENREQQDTQKLNRSNSSGEPQVAFVLYPRAGKHHQNLLNTKQPPLI